MENECERERERERPGDEENHITMRASVVGDKMNKAPALPSDYNPDHVYGRSSAAPTVEETRYTVRRKKSSIHTSPRQR